MNLFQSGVFRLASGEISGFKIECDALTGDDWLTLAQLIAQTPFGSVEPVPRGGNYLASLLSPLCTDGPHLIVDDVLTTGLSIKKLMGPDDIGFVVFARGLLPPRVRALFAMEHV